MKNNNNTSGKTTRDIINHLANNAALLYETNFPERIPSKDYSFYSLYLSNKYYEISAQRITRPTITELSYELSDVMNISAIRDSEVQYHIRNKIYCFIHYIYQFHLGEKNGRNDSENLFKKSDELKGKSVGIDITKKTHRKLKSNWK